jgi:hypothetical protein
MQTQFPASESEFFDSLFENGPILVHVVIIGKWLLALDYVLGTLVDELG